MLTVNKEYAENLLAYVTKFKPMISAAPGSLVTDMPEQLIRLIAQAGSLDAADPTIRRTIFYTHMAFLVGLTLAIDSVDESEYSEGDLERARLVLEEVARSMGFQDFDVYWTSL